MQLPSGHGEDEADSCEREIRRARATRFRHLASRIIETVKLESELSSLKGLKKYSNGPFDSYSLIAIEFVATADINDSPQRLSSKNNDAEAERPRDAAKPTVNAISVALHRAPSDLNFVVRWKRKLERASHHDPVSPALH
ncbi:hypothetical protein Enr13x_44240 [Stieleria neptunia]|uniref:Uncharacterized protein n=1 Tax=Stieleria neptunia TaxID=2527979 RepID=A0A518HUM5_9BACT|nr:hypothetical protein [Stieleria neptunia]QDV44558.1 hypothetical protein Enr13x_44240 [Stieleria neptunia]